MNEILFRAKRVDNNEWVYGNYVEAKMSGCFILSTKMVASKNVIKDDLETFEVNGETVCQYINIVDVNKKKIFEHDIVKFWRINTLGYTNERIGEVLYYDNLPVFYIMSTTGDAWDWCDCENIEVIGNSYENKELLEKKPWS